jgi:8-oxo-dGTP pyrophosphatase MutT (NUDIX family)
MSLEPSEDYVIRCLREASSGGETHEYNESRLSRGIEPRCAAVLVPLIDFGDEWQVLFTRRTENLDSHKGQVSFPGGACEPGEATPEQTALREAEEEIGLRPTDVRLLGRLNPMITITGFRVTPVVGVLPWPYTFRVSNVEVGRVFTIPLLWLADGSNYWEFARPGSDLGLIAYHPYDGELLWGATARMTQTFLQALKLTE